MSYGIRLSEKQNEYIREANHRINLKIGAVRSGKSFVDIGYVILERLRQVKGKDGLNLILGVSGGTIERNVLQPMREIYTDKIVGTINNSKGTVKIFGQDVYCLGAEKINSIGKIQGMSVKYLYGDEIAKWNKEVFMMALSRLDKEYSKMDGACNPESPNHWLKEFTDNDSIDLYVQHYKIWDNPFLPQNFIDNLCKEYEGTVYYGRYIEGLWTLAEGLVFPKFEEALVDSPPDTPAQEYCLSMDYGTLNPLAVILWERHENVWYAVDEIYYSGKDTGIQKTDGEYLDMMLDFVRPIMDKIKPTIQRRNLLGGASAFKIPVIIDPSAASMITLLSRTDIFRPIQADNDVYSYGLQNTNMALHNGLIKICKNMRNWIDEAHSYVWDDRSVVDQVIKDNDHLMDATRYFVNTKRLARADYKYTSIFGG